MNPLFIMDDFIEYLIEKGSPKDFVTCDFVYEKYLNSELFKQTQVFDLTSIYTSAVWKANGGVYNSFLIQPKYKTCSDCGRRLFMLRDVYTGVKLKTNIISKKHMCNCGLFV